MFVVLALYETQCGLLVHRQVPQMHSCLQQYMFLC